MLKLDMGFLEGKKILIVGVANKFSIASGIAEAMHKQGAELILSYQSERLKDKVMKLGDDWNCKTYIECDVSSDESISNMMEVIKDKWTYLDGIVHAVGFAPANELDGDFIEAATRDGFKIAHDVSVYSFTALAKAGRPLMEGRNASLLTLSSRKSKLCFLRSGSFGKTIPRIALIVRSGSLSVAPNFSYLS